MNIFIFITSSNMMSKLLYKYTNTINFIYLYYEYGYGYSHRQKQLEPSKQEYKIILLCYSWHL